MRGAALLTRRTGRWGIDTRFANSLGSERSRDARLEPIRKLLTPAGSLVHFEIVLVSVHARRDGQGKRRVLRTCWKALPLGRDTCIGSSAVCFQPSDTSRSLPPRYLRSHPVLSRIAALNVLSAARQKLDSLDKVTRVVRLCVYLATDGDFFDHPKVCRRCLRALPRCLWRRQNLSPYGVRRGKSSSGHACGR